MMKIGKYFAGKSVLVVVLALPIGLMPFLQASAESYGTSELASIANDGSSPNNTSSESVVSPDGRYVYFESTASNLVANDTNNASDIFVHDRMTDTTTLLDTDTSGVEANKGADSFGISDGGRYLVFTSSSTNLVDSEYNNNNAVFVRDLKTGVTSLAYQNHSSGISVGTVRISGDGNWILFSDTEESGLLYLMNRSTLELTNICNGLNGAYPNAECYDAQVNYDGSSVVFDSVATNLVNNDTNRQQDVFLWQKSSNSISRIDVSASGTQTNAESMYPYISGDGNKIVFSSDATNLVSPATRYANVYLYTVDSGTLTLISTSSGGGLGDFGSGTEGISEDGHDVEFESNSTNLVSNDNLSGWNMYVKNLDDNTTTLVSYDDSGNQINTQGFGHISADGQYLTFAATPSSGYRSAYLRY